MAKTTTTPAAAPAPAQVPTIAIKDRGVQARIRALRDIESEIKHLTERANECKRIIKAAMGDAEEATVGGVKVCTYKTTIRSSLSATLVKKAYPEVARECTVDSQVRTFKLVDPE